MKNIPIDCWKPDPPQRKVGSREFQNDHTKDGYQSESMYEYPRERRTVEERNWRVSREND